MGMPVVDSAGFQPDFKIAQRLSGFGSTETALSSAVGRQTGWRSGPLLSRAEHARMFTVAAVIAISDAHRQ